MNDSKNRNTANLITIIAVYFAANVIFIINPAMNGFAKDIYSNIDYNTVLLISAVSCLFMIPGSLIAPLLLGKKVSFKAMTLISMGGIIVAGILPYFIRKFIFTLIMRAIVGFCIGLGFPLQSTLAIRLFDEKSRPKALGIGSIFMSIGGILYQLISGAVCTINAAYAWLVHGVIIIPFVLVLIFMKEPKKTEEPINIDTTKAKSKEKMPGIVYFSAIMFMLIFMSFYPMLLNLSAILDAENIGNAAMSGAISSMYTVGGVIAGIIYAAVQKKAKKFTTPLALLVLILAYALFVFSHSIVPMIIASFLCGVGIFVLWPATIFNFSKCVPDSKVSMSTALFVSGMTLGSFASSYFITLIVNISGNTDPRFPCTIGLIAVAVFGIIWAITEIVRKKY